MSRKGNCLDNARMESFFAVLKTELFKLQKFSSIEELKTAIAKYIRYYNGTRLHSGLGLAEAKGRFAHFSTKARSNT